MAEYKIVNSTQLDADLTSIANAIREKNGTSNKYLVSEMGEAIRSIQSGDLLDSGKCGVGATYELHRDGRLVISGFGAIYDYNTTGDSGQSPWAENGYANSVTSVEIQNGITRIGNRTFDWNLNLSIVHIPEGVQSIGEGAFARCPIVDIYIPDSLTQIEKLAFVTCDPMNVYYSGTESQWDSVIIGEDNSPIINSTFYFEYSPSSGADNGWIINVIDDGSEPENITKPTITFVYTAGG